MLVILGKLEIKQYTFTAIAETKADVTVAILKSWIKFCQVEKQSPYGKHFASESDFKAAIHYITMELGIAYRLYNNVPPMAVDGIKGDLVKAKKSNKKPAKSDKEIRKEMRTAIKKQVKKQVVDQLIETLQEIRKEN